MNRDSPVGAVFYGNDPLLASVLTLARSSYHIDVEATHKQQTQHTHTRLPWTKAIGKYYVTEGSSRSKDANYTQDERMYITRQDLGVISKSFPCSWFDEA